VKKKISGLIHHNLFFDESLKEHAEEIYENPRTVLASYLLGWLASYNEMFHFESGWCQSCGGAQVPHKIFVTVKFIADGADMAQ